jgi:hypothetical protein
MQAVNVTIFNFLPLQDYGVAFKCISQIRMMEIDRAAIDFMQF